MTTREFIENRGDQKIYSGSLIQSLISDLWETMDSNMENIKGILILRHASKHLERLERLENWYHNQDNGE